MTDAPSDDAPTSIELGNLIEVVVHAVGRAHNRLHGDKSGSPGKHKPPRAYGGNIVIRAWVNPEGESSALTTDTATAQSE